MYNLNRKSLLFFKNYYFQYSYQTKQCLKINPSIQRDFTFFAVFTLAMIKTSMHSSSTKKPKISHSGTVMELGTATQAG